MELSTCMMVKDTGTALPKTSGLLVYLGHKGELYEIIGGDKKGNINLRNLK